MKYMEYSLVDFVEISDNDKELVNKWKEVGLLDGISNSETKSLIATLFETTLKTLKNDTFNLYNRKEVEIYIFPIIRRLLTHSDTLFTFYEKELSFDILPLIAFYDCYTTLTNELKKHLSIRSDLDVEAELMVYFCDLCDLSVGNKNFEFKKFNSYKELLEPVNQKFTEERAYDFFKRGLEIQFIYPSISKAYRISRLFLMFNECDNREDLIVKYIDQIPSDIPSIITFWKNKLNK